MLSCSLAIRFRKPRSPADWRSRFAARTRQLLPLEIVLLAEMIADLDQHGDAFGVARFCRGFLVRAGAEFPAVAVAEHRDDDAVRAVGVDLQLSARHRDQFGFGLLRLAHDISPAVAADNLPLRRAPVEGTEC